MGELHKVIQEVQLNDDSVTDELLIFALKKNKQDDIWGMMTRMMKLIKFC